jgi:N6-L-threonylcarbamoyladenine synthase
MADLCSGEFMSPLLAIESSCDETAVALYSVADRSLLAHHVYSQTALHAPYGGVVPELASRDHIRQLLPLVFRSLEEAKLCGSDLSGIAYTKGPGLVGALMVGATVARSLAYGWGIPSLGVHHLEAHLLAVMLEVSVPSYPFLSLLVSGGHTLLVQVHGLGQYRVLGETVDDAAGEAFDKTAKYLGLAYPGGPALAKLAEKGDSMRFRFPRPMLRHPGCEFSFSGLKTHAAQCFIKNKSEDAHANNQLAADISASFQEAVIDVLLRKTKRALEITGDKELVVAGGVSANKNLRKIFAEKLSEQGVQVFYPRHEFCTDNAAMVAVVGGLRLRAGERDGDGIEVKTRWSLEDLCCPRGV